MTPEEKFELLKQLLQYGAEVRTYYKKWRVLAVEKKGNYVIIEHEKGTEKVHMRDFARRRFIAVI
jgi:hypothetical protein